MHFFLHKLKVVNHIGDDTHSLRTLKLFLAKFFWFNSTYLFLSLIFEFWCIWPMSLFLSNKSEKEKVVFIKNQNKQTMIWNEFNAMLRHYSMQTFLSKICSMINWDWNYSYTDSKDYETYKNKSWSWIDEQFKFLEEHSFGIHSKKSLYCPWNSKKESKVLEKVCQFTLPKISLQGLSHYTRGFSR